MENKRKSTILDRLNKTKTVCRVCFSKVEKELGGIKSIFEKKIADILNLICSSVEFLKDDYLPDLICIQCQNMLKCAYELITNLTYSEMILKEYLNQDPVRFLPSENETTNNSVNADAKKTSILKNEDFDIKNDMSDIESTASDCSTSFSEKICIESRSKPITDKENRKKVAKHCCGLKFFTKVHYMRHLQKHVGIKKQFECSVCKKKYQSQYELKIHTRTHSGIRPFSCSYCDKSFMDKRNLKKHEKIHVEEKNHECVTCNRKFLHLFSLKTHEKTHTGEKPFVCESCGNAFVTATQLKIHSRIHTQEKPYSCGLCPREFASKSALSAHQITHTGHKNHVCTICGKSSRNASDLKTHIRTHTGEKPFHCSFPYCDKEYRTQSHLAVHRRTHTGEKRHQCTVCQRKFDQSSNLKRHLKTHEQKNLSCEFCGRDFGNVAVLRRHVEVHQMEYS